MEKRHLDRRLAQMEAEGTEFRTERRTSASTSPSTSSAPTLDAVVLAGGATAWRDLPVPGRELDGHPPGDGVPARGRTGCRRATSTSRTCRSPPRASTSSSSAAATPGPTASAPSHRQGPASVTQLEILPRPADGRPDANPWPTYPMSYKVTSAHEEGGERVYAVNTECFLGDDDGSVRALRLHEVERCVDGPLREGRGHRPRDPRASSCCWPWASSGPSRRACSSSSASSSTPRTTSPATTASPPTSTASSWPATWAAARASSCGRSPRGAARPPASTRYLMGETALPRIIDPTDRPLT